MNLSAAGVALLQRSEGCKLVAYLDSANIPTIGYGTIRYPDGRRVKMGDTCTQEQADAWFRHDLTRFERDVDELTVDAIQQRQFDALVSFAYNVGTGNYRNSTLRKKVNFAPDDPAIRAQFMRWFHAGGEAIQGLWNRRHREADFYFGVTTPCPEFPG